MRRQRSLLFVALLIGWSAPAHAQLSDRATQILAAAQLPVVTAQARREGVDSDAIRVILDAMRGAGVPAYEASALLDTMRVVRRDIGPADNFGAFVQSQLAAGLRGRALAAAIRAEHVRQGKGSGARGAQGRAESDKPGNRGRGRGPSTPPKP